MNEFKTMTEKIFNILLDDNLFYSYYNTDTGKKIRMRILKSLDQQHLYIKMFGLFNSSRLIIGAVEEALNE